MSLPCLATTNSWRYLCHGSSATTAAYSSSYHYQEQKSQQQAVSGQVHILTKKTKKQTSQPIDIQRTLAATIEQQQHQFFCDICHSSFIKHTHQYDFSSRKNYSFCLTIGNFLV
jgi:hypothetical protein